MVDIFPRRGLDFVTFSSVFRKTASIILAVFLLLEPLAPAFAQEVSPETPEASATTSAPVETTPVITIPKGTKPPQETSQDNKKSDTEFKIENTENTKIAPPPENTETEAKKEETTQSEAGSQMAMSGAVSASQESKLNPSNPLVLEESRNTSYTMLVGVGGGVSQDYTVTQPLVKFTGKESTSNQNLSKSDRNTLISGLTKLVSALKTLIRNKKNQ